MSDEMKLEQLDESTASSSGEGISETEHNVELFDAETTEAWYSADPTGYLEEMWYNDLLVHQMANPYLLPYPWSPELPWFPPHPAAMMFPPFFEMPHDQPKRKKQQAKAKAKSMTTSIISSDAKTEADASSESNDQRTTIMLRNLPNDYTRDMLLKLLDDQGFGGKYDFAYLPVDFSRWGGFGYAFVNFVTSEGAESAKRQFHGFCSWELKSSKICEVSWSDPVQGLEENINRYRNSPVMHELVPDSVRPVLFQDGKRIDFPEPTKKIRPPRVKKHPGGMTMAVRTFEACVDSFPTESVCMPPGLTQGGMIQPCHVE